MIPLPAADVVARRRGGSYGRWRTRTRNLPEVSGELPVVALAEEMLTDGPGQIRGLLTAAGNPVLSTPDGRQLDEALENLDFMVSIDLYINETTRHADVILPPTAPLEHDHYDLAFHALAIRDTSRYSPALFQAAPGALHDWQIYAELLRRLRPKVSIQERLGRWLSRKMGPSGMLDVLLRTGPHGAGMLGLGKGLTLKRLKAQPHGVDLGPLKPVLRDRIRTKNKHIQLAPKLFVDDLTRLRAKLDDSRRDDSASELLLIGRRQVRSNNSWMHNYPRLMRGKDRCTLLMHPDDAAERNISVGQIARVSSRVGSVEVPVELSDEIMRGVVSIPHGWGHHRSGARLSTAGAHPGVSINDLTDPTLIDELSGNAAFSGVPVQVEAMASTENQGSKAVSSNAAGG